VTLSNSNVICSDKRLRVAGRFAAGRRLQSSAIIERSPELDYNFTDWPPQARRGRCKRASRPSEDAQSQCLLSSPFKSKEHYPSWGILFAGNRDYLPGGRQMAVTFISSLLDGVDIFLGFSLILFVAAMIATYGEQIRMRP
jgi:hypothetical protein